MAKYTYKSSGKDGTYYFVNHWDYYRLFWTKNGNNLFMFFDSASRCKASMTKLLKVMPEYALDKLELIKIDDGNESVVETRNNK